MDELPDVPALRTLEPPPGGLEALRERLAARPRRWWYLAVPALAIAVIAVLLLTPRSQTPHVAPSPETALRDRDLATDGTFYWVASTPGQPVRARSQIVSIDEVPVVHDFAPP